MSTFFHLGYPKTGTTSLQRYVFNGLPGIDLVHEPYETFSFGVVNNFRFGVGAAYDESEGAIKKEILGRKKPVIVSNEAFLDLPLRLSEHERLAKRISRLDSNSKILITIRNQFDIIKSMYTHGFERQSMSLGWPKTKHALPPVRIDFNEWVYLTLKTKWQSWVGNLLFDTVKGVWAEEFGEENVHVIPMELMANNKAAFSSRLSALLGVDYIDVFERMPDNAPNPAISRPTAYRFGNSLNYFRRRARSNKFIGGILKKDKMAGRALKEVGNNMENVLRKAGGRRAIVLSESNKNLIAETFATENCALAKKIDIDLKELGYPV